MSNGPSVHDSESTAKYWADLAANAKDPVKSCQVYKSEGCTHVGGMLCNMGTCSILSAFVDNRNSTARQ